MLSKMSLQGQSVSDIIPWYCVKAPAQASAQHLEREWWWDGEKARQGGKDRAGCECKDGIRMETITQTFLFSSLQQCSPAVALTVRVFPFYFSLWA